MTALAEWGADLWQLAVMSCRSYKIDSDPNSVSFPDRLTRQIVCLEKIRKKEKIMLDKWGTGWYSIEAVRQDGPAERRCVRKQIEKDLKKALDKAMRRW